MTDSPESANGRPAGPIPARRHGKSEAAFRTISEVEDHLDVPQHVLRFWETKFSQVRPLKRAGGRRYYRPEDVALLRRIRDLLYRDGLTIKGVQRLIKEHGARGLIDAAELQTTGLDLFDHGQADAAPAEPAPAGSLVTVPRQALESLLAELEILKALLGA